MRVIGQYKSSTLSLNDLGISSMSKPERDTQRTRPYFDHGFLRICTRPSLSKGGRVKLEERSVADCITNIPNNLFPHIRPLVQQLEWAKYKAEIKVANDLGVEILQNFILRVKV